MSRVKLTPWFDGSVKPALPGVYEREPIAGWGRYSYWTGKAWMCSGHSIGAAYAYRKAWVSNSQSAAWRGLAEEPKR